MDSRRFRWLSLAALALIGMPGVARPQQPPPSPSSPPLSVLTVGGGPNREQNQVAIESNVRYVDRLLPSGATRRVLFGDGQGVAPIVQFREEGAELPAAERALRVAFGQPTANSKIAYRKPQVPVLNGASTRVDIAKVVGECASEPATRPLLVYFTGHGNQNRNDIDNNTYALWGERGLTVQELTAELAKLPADRPVVVVMVQCYSGAFGNIIFKDGSPANELSDQPVCGFFATTRERVAAGCTPEVNEADYDDFTSYFFAGLTGTDRLGRSVPAPDYNRDGRVGMDEAFAYAIITEPSADVPVATSDVFLRRYVQMTDDEVVAEPYADILRKASPSQKAALEALSKALGGKDEDRLKTALAVVRQQVGAGGPQHAAHADDFGPGDVAKLNTYRQDLLTKFPGLRNRRNQAAYAAARAEALKHLEGRPSDVAQMLKLGEGVEKVAKRRYEEQLKGARYLRILRVAKSVVLEGRLRASGKADLVARFDALKKREAGNPFRTGKSASVALR